MKAAILAGALLTLSACDRMAVLVKGEPYDAQCSAQCALPCDEPMDLADGDPNTLLAVSKVNRAYLVRCSARRDACAECLDRLRQAKVIR